MNQNTSIVSKYKHVLEGPKVTMPKTYGGLGTKYLNSLEKTIVKIHQVDTVTGVTETNDSVRSRAIQLAQALKSLGIVENDVVLIYSRCHADQTIVVLATLFLAAIVAPLNPQLTHNECLSIVRKLKPKICFCDLRQLKQIERVLEEASLSAQLVYFGSEVTRAIPFARLFRKKYLSNFAAVFVEHPEKSVAFILPTQGTTGPQKLVCISHHNIYIQTVILYDIMNSPQMVLSFFPLAWFMQVYLTCMAFEYTVLRILPGTCNERTACKLIHDYRIDCAFLGSYFAMKLVDNVALKDFDLSCLKTMIIGCISTNLYNTNRLTSLLKKVKFIQIYGATETGCIAACFVSNYSEFLEKTEAVGKIVQNCKVKLVDRETREALGPDECGELIVTGDGLMLRYLDDEDGTTAAMEKNYFKTGDYVRYDRDGWLYISARIEDLITIDSSCFPPSEIENQILTHPFVEDVVVIGNEKGLLACVIKKPDTKLTEDKIMTFIMEGLQENRKPTKIAFMEEFPKTSVGKIKRGVMRNDLLKVKIRYSKSLASISV